MPLIELTQEQRDAGLAALSPEVTYLLEEKRVEEPLRAILGHLQIVDVEILSAIATDEPSFRKMLKEDVGLDPEEGIESRIKAAHLVNAWRAAKERVSRQEAMDAEARAEGRPRELPRPSQISIRKGYEEAHGELDASVCPSFGYSNDRVVQIEENDFRAEALSQVVSFEEAREETADPELSFSLTRASTVKLSRTRARVPPPKDAEELRARYKIMSAHWEMMKLKHPGRAVFKHLDGKVWADVLDYLLGPTVAKYRSSKGVGLAWEDLLKYEFEIRKKAMRLVTNSGYTIADAIKKATKDDELRSLHFTLQLVTSGRSARSRSPRRSPRRERGRDNAPKGKSKGGGKQDSKGKGGGKDKGGKGKGGGSESNNPAAFATYLEAKKNEKLTWRHGGKNVCVRYNRGDCWYPHSCREPHVCLRCGGSHPIHSCPNPKIPK